MKLPENKTLLKLLDAHRATLLQEDATPNFTFSFSADETVVVACAHRRAYMSNVDAKAVHFWFSLWFTWDERRWRWTTDGAFRHTYLPWLGRQLEQAQRQQRQRRIRRKEQTPL
ncbi:hypothetical protein N9S81_00370 [bacterium]|nr:hypothetical protein [bacterium]